MKKVPKANTQSLIKKLMSYEKGEMYTRQTLVSLFRCFLETVIENRFEAVVLVRIKNICGFEGLLNRLKYSDSNVYTYLSNIESDKFKQINIDDNELGNDEFIVIVTDRFSVNLCWNESDSEVVGLCESFCSFNPDDTKQIIDYLQSLKFDTDLDNKLANIKLDRRHNEKFTLIVRKLVSSLENRQRDLICANSELTELHEKNIQAEKLAAIGQFCSTIAHEIRNPLSLISLYSNILSKNIEKINLNIDDDKITDSLNNAIHCIRNAVENLEGLLTELINYSKPIEIKKNNINLKNTVENVINLIKPAYQEKNVILELNYPSEQDFTVKFDKQKLEQAILNVVKNALEVSKKGDKVKIDIEILDDKKAINIKFSDQGEGILPEYKNKIFTPYFTTKKNGTGLGLAFSKKIAELHGGDLAIFATGPKGTIFCLTLPTEKV